MMVFKKIFNKTRGLLFGVLILSAVVVFFIFPVEGDACRKGSFIERSLCWEETLSNLAGSGRIGEAFETLLTLYENDEEVSRDCHAYAHVIGEKASDVFIRDGTIEISPLSSLCGYGFYHGFMESVLFATGDITRMRDFCAHAGEELLKSGLTGGLYACYHGFGHGITDGSDPRAWGDPLKMSEPALKICDDIGETPFLKSRCATGVFNALEILSSDSKYNLTDSLGLNPFSICHNQPSLYREPCYTNMIIAVLRLTNNDIAASASYIIDNIPNPDEETTISGTVLENALRALFAESVRLYGDRPDYPKEEMGVCRTLPERMSLSCILGISEGYIKYGRPGREYERAISFCSSELLQEREKVACFEDMVESLPTKYTPSEIAHICSLFNPSYQHFCVSDDI